MGQPSDSHAEPNDRNGVDEPQHAQSGASGPAVAEVESTEPALAGSKPDKWDPPISANWRKDRRRNGAGIVSLFLVAMLGWITVSQTFIVLANNRLVHPSSLSWPLYLCLAGIAGGCYVFLAADRKWMPFPGREYESPDHSTRYTLWFAEPTIEWRTFSAEPHNIHAQVGILIKNGGTVLPIVTYLEKLDVKLNDVGSVMENYALPLRLLPDQIKRFISDGFGPIPHGNTTGEISYTIRYGPVSGFPVYRRTHKVRIHVRQPITPQIVSLNPPGLTWYELEPELDTDVDPPEAESPTRLPRSHVKRRTIPKEAKPWYGLMGPPDRGYDLMNPTSPGSR